MTGSSVPQFGPTTEQLLAAVKGHQRNDVNQRKIPSTTLSTTEPTTRSPPTTWRSNRQAPSHTMPTRPSGFNGPYVRPTGISQQIRTDNAWRSQVEIGVQVDGLPEGVTTLDVYRCFRREGPISRIQVPGPRSGPRSKASSYVNFSSPPHRAFWAGEGPPIVIPGEPGMPCKKLSCMLTQHRGLQVQSPVRPGEYYDECMTLSLDALDFGFMESATHFVAMQSAAVRKGSGPQITLNLRFRKLVIEFSLPHQPYSTPVASGELPELAMKYKLEIPVQELRVISQLPSTDGSQELLFSIMTPPDYYYRTKSVEATHDPMSTEWCSWYAWFRMTDLAHDTDQLKEQPLALRKKHQIIDLGRWTTYRIQLGEYPNKDLKFDVFRRALEDHNVIFRKLENTQRQEGLGKEATMWSLIDPPVDLDSKSSLAGLDLDMIVLPFAVRYQLEVCISRGVFNEHSVTGEFLKSIMELGQKRAVAILESAALRHNMTSEPYFQPEAIFKLPPSKPTRISTGGHAAYMRAAQVTPTNVYYTTPVLETSNRVIRHFFAYEDRFLRVRFSDERGKIRAKEKEINEAIFQRVRRVLIQGIRIGDRHYEFLAFGNSQFRENAAYFFASTENLKASEIRTWMGDFRGIRTIAKWAARLGQSFSTTRSINGARVKVNTTTDIVRNGYTFSDGVGKISPFLAQLVAIEFGLRAGEGVCPSLFQFRLGGCKGVLVVDPSLAKSQAQEIVIRESQYKFPAVHEGLDVIRYSSFAASTLNRQIILVLNTLEVPAQTFLDKQERELAEIEQSMKDQSLALDLLQRRIDFNQMTLTIAQLILDGFMTSKEPFMMSILHLWRAWNVKYLKEKARITIDKGAFLLGCVDETASLRGHYTSAQGWHEAYGLDSTQWIPEIFVQVRDPPHTGPYRVQSGLCLLARNPSLHAGDVRVVRAVDAPALHHLRDVVVFPQTGDRDLANMCSGGDLDGDDYLVMWDKELFPPAASQNREAMDFKPPTGAKLDRYVNIEDVKSFFVEYMKCNRLELIAVSHLAQADQSPFGVDDPRCIELAELHSCAVDYPKSGQPAILNRKLIPRRWPHFMGKDPKVSYESKSVLGQLYNHVQLVDFNPLYELQPDKRVLESHCWTSRGMLEIMQQVREVKEEYDKSVRRIMAKHAIGTEFEVWSTFVLNHSRAMGDYKFHEEIGNLAESLKTQYKDEIARLAGGAHFKQLEPWVAAMYKVTADEMESALTECRQTVLVGGFETPKRRKNTNEMPLVSFPWIFHSELGKIATGRKRDATAVGADRTTSLPQATNDVISSANAPASKEEVLIPEIEAPSGQVVRAGEELKLFEDETDPLTPEAAAQEPANRLKGKNREIAGSPIDGNDGVQNTISVTDRRVSTGPRETTSGIGSPDSTTASERELDGDLENDVPDASDPIRKSALDRLTNMMSSGLDMA